MDLNEILETLLAHADDLRARGVTKLVAAGVEVHFAPPLPPEPMLPVGVERHHSITGDPMDDPELYGGDVPRLRRVERGNG